MITLNEFLIRCDTRYVRVYNTKHLYCIVRTRIICCVWYVGWSVCLCSACCERMCVFYINIKCNTYIMFSVISYHHHVSYIHNNILHTYFIGIVPTYIIHYNGHIVVAGRLYFENFYAKNGPRLSLLCFSFSKFIQKHRNIFIAEINTFKKLLPMYICMYLTYNRNYIKIHILKFRFMKSVFCCRFFLNFNEQ